MSVCKLSDRANKYENRKNTIIMPISESGQVCFLNKGSLSRSGISDRKITGLSIHSNIISVDILTTTVSQEPAGTGGGVIIKTMNIKTHET